MADDRKTDESTTAGTAKVVAEMVVFIFIILTTAVGNSLVCISVIKFRHLRTNTNFILLSLALTDLSMVIVMTLNATTTVTGKWIWGEFCCRAVASAGLTLSFISILHLCFLSVDRYIAIQKPFRYKFVVTRRRVMTILLLIWLSVAVILNIPLADFDFRADTYGCADPENKNEKPSSPYIFFMVALFVVIPFAIIFFSNAVVFKTAFMHARQLSREERRLRESLADICEEDDEDPVKSPETRSFKREMKSARTFALVVGIFLLCYTPFYTAGTYRRVAGPVKVPSSVMLITMWIGFANSSCNPIVYGLRYTPFREAFKILCSCGRKDNYSFAKSSSSGQRERQGTTLSTLSSNLNVKSSSTWQRERQGTALSSLSGNSVNSNSNFSWQRERQGTALTTLSGNSVL